MLGMLKGSETALNWGKLTEKNWDEKMGWLKVQLKDKRLVPRKENRKE